MQSKNTEAKKTATTTIENQLKTLKTKLSNQYKLPKNKRNKTVIKACFQQIGNLKSELNFRYKGHKKNTQ